MLIQTWNKWDCAKAFINTLLKDTKFYCNNCDEDFNPLITNDDGHWVPCCDDPQVGRTKEHVRAIAKQNRDTRELCKNETATLTETGAMRHGVSMPPRLLYQLERYFIDTYKQKLWADNKELHKFMKEFPQFCIPRRV